MSEKLKVKDYGENEGRGAKLRLGADLSPPFLPLMEEKEAKEDQGVRDAGQVPLPRQGPSGTPAKWAGRIRVPGRLFIFTSP